MCHLHLTTTNVLVCEYPQAESLMMLLVSDKFETHKDAMR